MILYVDTNWLAAAYFHSPERGEITERFAKRHEYPWHCSRLVYLESRNVFAALSGRQNSPEWRRLNDDLGSRIILEQFQWAALEPRAFQLMDRYSHKDKLGTWDLFIVAGAQLAGATHFLSFDRGARAVAAAERLTVFPELGAKDNDILAKLRR